MWPSYETASLLQNIGNWLLIGSLIIGVISTVIVVWTGNIKESYLLNDVATAQQNAITSQTNLAELKRHVGPRQIKRDVFLRALEGQPKARVEIMYLRDDPECFDVAQQVWQLLQDAHWDTISPVPIPQNNSSGAIQLGPTPMSFSGQPSGITIAAHSITLAEAEAGTNQIMGKEWIKTPFTVLVHAIGESLGSVNSWAKGPNAPPSGTLRIIIAPRM